MLTQILLDTTHTAVLAIEQPESVAPPMAPKVWRIVGVILWTMTIGAVVGIIVGGGWMWVDHVSDRGATGGKGVKIVMGAFMGAAVMAAAASMVTFAMS
ncbi:hypothetical protein GS894_23680 [Rhodococcus hoagii]|uniref:hypothetical protein n=1 Tax=Rhodococcus hoagii TaxID=43767 RepID=UPI000A10AAFA|nr:hypothetical protein [Prescottella equi]MCD7053104.1 hypothetical protein [Rhodococcus sp. BH2-1]MDP8017610.1 hypothetical protein [Prescottella equi]NKS55536.1 hypothetical protein [Prescottella equi]NKS64808.1 hypothetical protein [Prescottella equi]NKS71970.1 hypothetical protein [Prescottella equi]